jgi:hypothetical protein
MPRTPRKKEIKKVEIIEDVKEPEPEPEEPDEPEPEVETEQHPSTDEDIELEIPKKRPKPRTEKQLEQLRLAREKSLLNKEAKRKQKEEEQQAIKKELESKIQAEKKAIEEKIVKKALSIKKKEIKKQEILDEISDDETPIEQIKVPVKKESSLKETSLPTAFLSSCISRMFPLNLSKAFMLAAEGTMSPCLSMLSSVANPETILLSMSTFAIGIDKVRLFPSDSQCALEIFILLTIIPTFYNEIINFHCTRLPSP